MLTLSKHVEFQENEKHVFPQLRKSSPMQARSYALEAGNRLHSVTTQALHSYQVDRSVISHQ